MQFTLRPTTGISDEDLKSVKAFLTKNCDYYHVITEKLDEERHVHTAIILKDEDTIKNFNRKAKRWFQYIVDQQRGLYLNGGKGLFNSGVWYNEDWYGKYCAKGDNTVVHFDRMCDEAERSGYYKDIPEEERRSTSTADPYLAKLERLWIEDGESLCRSVATGEVNIRNSCVRISRWISKKCFKDRVLRVIYDERRMRRTVKMLCCYLAKGEIDYMYGMTRDGESTVHGPPMATRTCVSCTASYEAATGYGHHVTYD